MLVEQILRRPEVSGLTGKPCSSLYADISRGLFPPAVSLGAKSVGWPESEVAAINAARIAGKTDDEIRTIVSDLVARRRHAARRAA